MSQLGVQTAQHAASVAAQAQAGVISQPSLARVQLPARVPDSRRARPRKAAQPLAPPRDMGMGKSPLAPESLRAAFIAVEQLERRAQRQKGSGTDSESVRDHAAGDGVSFLEVHHEQSDAGALGDFRQGRYESFASTEELIEGFEA